MSKISARRSRGSLAADPTLIGAVTSLVVVVAVFLAYNANSGLPFVPTYEVTVRLPDAAELVAGNDVRKDGARVGAVSEIRAVRTATGAYATAKLKLEERAGPLPVDTHAVVRQRSSLGLKYLEVLPGRSRSTIATGGRLENAGTRAAVDLDDVLGTFDGPTRAGVNELLDGLAPGLAGRGADLNRTLEELPALLGSLSPVMRNLAASETDLPGLIRAGNSAFAALQPVAPLLGDLLDDGATTFAALDDPPSVRRLLSVAAANFRPIGTELRAARPGLRATVGLLTALRPALRRLPETSRTFGPAVGGLTEPLVRIRPVLVDARPVLTELRRTLRFPSTSTALRQVAGLAEETVPTLTYVNPFQTRCNYLGLWTRNVPAFISEGDDLGTWFRALPIVQSDEILARSTPAPGLHYDPYPDAGQGGTCEAGNVKYEAGKQVLGPSGQNAPGFTEPTSRPKLGAR